MSERLTRLRAASKAHELDACLINEANNRRYLSGFTGSNGWLFITADSATLITDGRYIEQAGRECPGFAVIKIARGEDVEGFRRLLEPFLHKRVALESDQVTLEQWRRWFHEAVEAGCTEPNAFVLSTIDHDGWPQSRYLLLRGADQRGFTMITVILTMSVLSMLAVAAWGAATGDMPLARKDQDRKRALGVTRTRPGVGDVARGEDDLAVASGDGRAVGRLRVDETALVGLVTVRPQGGEVGIGR